MSDNFQGKTRGWVFLFELFGAGCGGRVREPVAGAKGSARASERCFAVGVVEQIGFEAGGDGDQAVGSWAPRKTGR